MRLGMGLRLSDLLKHGATATPSTLLDGLVSYWPLDEESGTRYDAVGDNDLTDNNTVGSIIGGPRGTTVANFAAANGEYFDTGATAVLDPSADFTLSAWMTHPSAGAGYGSVLVGSPTAQVLMQTPNTGVGTGVLDYRVYTGTPAIVNPPTVFDLTFPRHIVVTWVSSTKALEVFVDGSSAGTASGGGAAASATVLWIGKHHGGALHEGTMSDFAIWSRVLTEDERAELYNAGSGFFYPFT